MVDVCGSTRTRGLFNVEITSHGHKAGLVCHEGGPLLFQHWISGKETLAVLDCCCTWNRLIEKAYKTVIWAVEATALPCTLHNIRVSSKEVVTVNEPCNGSIVKNGKLCW